MGLPVSSPRSPTAFSRLLPSAVFPRLSLLPPLLHLCSSKNFPFRATVGKGHFRLLRCGRRSLTSASQGRSPLKRAPSLRPGPFSPCGAVSPRLPLCAALYPSVSLSCSPSSVSPPLPGRPAAPQVWPPRDGEEGGGAWSRRPARGSGWGGKGRPPPRRRPPSRRHRAINQGRGGLANDRETRKSACQV